MGGRLRRRVLRETYGEDGLTVAARFTLTCMADHALDSTGRNNADPVGVYWGGHAQLAREVFGADTKANRRRITRIIRDLESRKLIGPHEGAEGYNRAYRVLP